MVDIKEQTERQGRPSVGLKGNRSWGTVEGLLYAESACLRSLEAITQEIGEAIAANEMESLGGKLARREEVIERIRDIEQRLRPLVSAQGERGTANPPVGSEDNDKVSEIKGQLESVLTHGKEIERLLVARRGELSGKLMVVQKCRKMMVGAAPAAKRRLDMMT